MTTKSAAFSTLFGMRMFQQCEEPRFTIEQINLLQRLRRTGIKQVEVVHALDALDHLARPRANSSLSHKPPSSSMAATSSVTSCATQTDLTDGRLSPSGDAFDGGALLLPLTVASPVAMATVAHSNGKLSPLGVAAPGYGFDTGEEDLDMDEKVEDLMRRDSALIKEEIKSFLANRRISQAVVAQVTGISQSRISHWLIQQGSDLSEQKKRAFFRWYQLEKTNPGATLALRAAPLALEDVMDWHQATPTFAPTPGAFRLRRGNRFTWKKECLAVMESYFSDNQYPDEAKREEISSACNGVIRQAGKKLLDFEKVTSLKVYNWFANRRKDLKRRASIATILESHGIDVQSPGGQSNSDEVDGNDFPEQSCDVSLFDKRVAARPFAFARADLSSSAQVGPAHHHATSQEATLHSPPSLSRRQVPTLLPSWLATLAARGGVSGQQRGGAVIARSFLSGAGVSWSPPSPSLQDEAATRSMLAEPRDAACLDTAAVNQVEGAGQSEVNHVKTEVMEDD
ncbi:homeobox-containing protein 1-like isoform X2 [Dunckerocampus dactyliophorus]|uniref:homeobox-containing protein 1-like isoform X2 n=1 Tax=Dunckerocampus dactyliophorus TaxID=161453 RepID=UPI0024076811|nr:homeobox-containing protein 1-like isoform X2 [Dunckerocampus dactyliophorus]